MLAIEDSFPELMDDPPRRDSSSSRVTFSRFRKARIALFKVALSRGGGRSSGTDSLTLILLSSVGPFRRSDLELF